MNGSLMLLTIAVYFGLLMLVSRIVGRKNTGNESFFLGDRQSPWYVIAIGMVGTSVSGISVVSVPGMVRSTDMTYMQAVFGFVVGYVVVANVLLPLYYRLKLTSIYTYLEERFGKWSYKSGASFFLLSKTVGSAAKLYLVVQILQTYVFDAWHVPFALTAAGCIFLIWLYTYRSGIQALIWTDTLQTICLVGVLLLMIWQVKAHMGLDLAGMVRTIADSPHARLFEFKDWSSTQHFAKQFFSGIFIVIVMTGLDQDLMQKNLSCRNLQDAKKNMYTYGFAFIPFNFLFLFLGILLLAFAAQQQVPLPEANDNILPMFVTSGLLGNTILLFFTLGIIAAAFNSADSALTALTTSFCIDILEIEKRNTANARRIRVIVHSLISFLFVGIILLFKAFNNQSLIDTIYKLVAYTYGPLLGLFAFGLFTKGFPRDKFVPYICIASPILCYLIENAVKAGTGYRFGYEMLMLNGALTFIGLWLASVRNQKRICDGNKDSRIYSK